MRKTITLFTLMLSTVAVAQEALPPAPPTPAPPPATVAPPPPGTPPVPPPLVAPPPQQPYYYPPPAYMQPGPAMPTRYELKPNYALIFSGVGVFGLGYMVDVMGTLVAGHDPAWECAIPVVGPYLQVTDKFSSDWGDLAKGFYVFDGLIQTAGLVLTVVGASLWHKVPVRMAQNGFAVTF
jgi:hypothetical protein